MAFSRRQFLLIPYIAVLSKHLNKLPQLPLPSIVTGWLVAAITSEQRDELPTSARTDQRAGVASQRPTHCRSCRSWP